MKKKTTRNLNTNKLLNHQYGRLPYIFLAKIMCLFTQYCLEDGIFFQYSLIY